MSASPGLSKTFWQVTRFLAVGSVATVADLLTYFLLVEVDVVITVAKALSYASGTILGFLGNKFWTFDSLRRNATEPIIYTVLYAVTLAVNVGINGLVLQLLADTLSLAWERGIAFVVATGITTILNFLGLRFLTFRSRFEDPYRDSSESEEEAATNEIPVA